MPGGYYVPYCVTLRGWMVDVLGEVLLLKSTWKSKLLLWK
jgi:hypothetical protein